MTAESFFEYISNVFYPWLIEENVTLPVILYVDGHPSHLSMAVSDFCNEKGIILVALFPNSTHILQPLDVAFFHPMKNEWSKAVQNWRIGNNCEQFKRENFAPVLKNVLDSVNSKKILESVFKTCGLYPFNPDAINYEKVMCPDIIIN